MIKLKLSSFLMKRNPSISRKLKRKQKQKRKLKVDDDADINHLPDELLVHILSRISINEAARTSVLAHRWRHLWRSVYGTLQFDFSDFVTANGDLIEVEKFVSRVNTVLGLIQVRYVEGLVVIFEGMHEKQYDMIPGIASAIDSWIYFAMQKEVERLELRFSWSHEHIFPSIEMLKSHSYGISSPFRRVRILRLIDVRIKDDVVHYFLASCPNLEELYIWHSVATKKLQVVDPPSLRVLELRRCRYLQSLEISADRLVSFACIGYKSGTMLLNRVPNLREFTIGNDYFLDFISNPSSSYSDQLVKLVIVVEMMVSLKRLVCVPALLPQFSSLIRLEVTYRSIVGRSLLFFASLIKASPQLCEFKIEMSYSMASLNRDYEPLPEISAKEAAKFNHTSLKVVELCGYVGCSSEHQLIVELLNNSAS